MRLRTTCPYRVLGLRSSSATLRVTQGALCCCRISRGKFAGAVGRLKLDTFIVKTHVEFSPSLLLRGVGALVGATKAGFLVVSKRRYARGATIVRAMGSVVLRAIRNIVCLFPY